MFQCNVKRRICFIIKVEVRNCAVVRETSRDARTPTLRARINTSDGIRSNLRTTESTQ
jgi:hypothetical protein